MNHLAHFLLAPADDGVRAGTLIADFSRGQDLSGFEPAVETGIRLHRRVDALVDASPLVADLKRLVDVPLRRYAGILLDVFFDYCLIRDWSLHAAMPRADFAGEVYASLGRMEAYMAPPAPLASARMRRFDALASCATHEGCARTLARIATRLKRPVDLAAGVAVLIRHEDEIAATLVALLPALREQTQPYFAGPSFRRRPSALSAGR